MVILTPSGTNFLHTIPPPGGERLGIAVGAGGNILNPSSIQAFR
jgi:hypothetical protein